MRKKASRRECMETPVYVRRFRLEIFKDMDEKQSEAAEEASNNTKGKKQRTLSPDELKAKLKNNEINPDNTV